MAKFKIRVTKKSAGGMKASAKAAAGTPPTNLQLLDNQNAVGTVQGEDAAGNPVDISALGTITAVSDTPGTVTATVSGMNVTVAAVGPLTAAGVSANVTITFTATDGSFGPFSWVQPVTIAAGPAGQIVVTFGTPTANP